MTLHIGAMNQAHHATFTSLPWRVDVDEGDSTSVRT
jgi:hypothetical protein